MHKIEKIKVSGFWDTHEIEASLFSDVTFFIGVNGTGKTTFINLIAAVLVGDFATLERMAFSSVEIHFTATSGNKKPSITVTKKRSEKRPFDDIRYSIKESQSGPEKSYSLSDFEERLLLHGEPDPRYYIRHGNTRRHHLGVIEAVRELVQVSWLSIHRITGLPRSSDDKSYESTIDRKLAQLSSDLGKYLSSVSKQKDEEVRKFQEFIFLSLLAETKEKDFIDPKGLEKLQSQKVSLIEIFQELHVPKSSYGNLVDNYFDTSKHIYSRLQPNKGGAFNTSELINLIGLLRLNNVIEKWQTLQSRLSEIFLHRDKFLTTVNKLFLKKELKFSEGNEIFFETSSGKHLSLQMLSSGEKQLLILLTEALLQRGRPFIYIADEPELSLHVSWQEKLISSIRTLNEQAQIVAATHSPDIIGTLSNRVLDMDNLIK